MCENRPHPARKRFTYFLSAPCLTGFPGASGAAGVAACHPKTTLRDLARQALRKGRAGYLGRHPTDAPSDSAVESCLRPVRMLAHPAAVASFDLFGSGFHWRVVNRCRRSVPAGCPVAREAGTPVDFHVGSPSGGQPVSRGVAKARVDIQRDLSEPEKVPLVPAPWALLSDPANCRHRNPPYLWCGPWR